MKLPKYNVSLSIQHNEYKNYYQSIEQALDQLDSEDFITPEEYLKALETGNLWEIQWYPNNPIGCYHYYASSLEALLEYVEKRFK